MSGSITRYELSDSLLDLIFNSNGSIIAKYTSRQEFTEPVTEVEIGIDNFNPDIDALFVYKNSVNLTGGTDYIISEDGKRIMAPDNKNWGERNKKTIYDFVVLKNIKDTSRIEGVDYVDGSLIEDGSITVDKLSQDLANKIYSLPGGGMNGALLVKNSDEDYDVKWTTNTACNVIINTFDNKSVKNVAITIRDFESGTISVEHATGSINHIELVPGKKYEISLGDKEGYVTPESQIITPVLGNINTLYFMYNTDMTACSILLETDDGEKVPPQTVYIRRVSDGVTHEIHSDGKINVYNTNVYMNTQYEIYASNIYVYITPPKNIINTVPEGVSNVTIRYSKDETFCDVEVAGIEISPTNYVDIRFINTANSNEYNLQMTNRTGTIKLPSKSTYKVVVETKKDGFIKPSDKYITTGENKSTLNLPLAYQLSTSVLTINVSTDNNRFVTGTEVFLTDGYDYNKKQILGESGTVSFQVNNGKTYTVTVGKMLGYARPNSESVLIKEPNTTIDFVFKKVNIYGFSVDLSNSDPVTSMEYIEDAKGFIPAKALANGTITYGDWLDTFITKYAKPVALLDGKRVGYLSTEEENRLENGENVPEDADYMVEFKKTYYSLNIIEEKLIFKISNYKVDNSYRCPAFLSERDGKTECEFMYYGMYEGSIDDSKLHSKQGKTIKRLNSISQFRSMVQNKGEGYQLETITKYNYLMLLTMLISKTVDIKTFVGKIQPESNILTATDYEKFRVVLPNRTIDSSLNLFYVNNLFNSPRFVEGCYMNGLKEIRYRQTAPYVPETNYSLVPTEYVNFADSLYVNHVKRVSVSGDLLFPVYEPSVNDATNSTYFASTIYAAPEEDVNKPLVINNQSEAEASSEPGYLNFCFISNNNYGARLTFTDER